MQTSFHTGILGEVPVLEAIAQVREAGFDGAELNAEHLPWAAPHVGPETPKELRRQLALTDSVSSIAAHREGLASLDEALRQEAVAWTIGCAQLASDIGTDIIHVIPGGAKVSSSLGEASGSASGFDSFVKSLTEVVRAAKPLGVKVGLEPIVNHFVETTEEALAVLREVESLGISFDPSHLEVTTHDVTGAAHKLGKRTIAAAIKDATGKPDDFGFVQLGTGDIDFVAMIRALREEGYGGFYCVEHESHLFGDSRLPAQVLTESYDFLKDALRKAGA